MSLNSPERVSITENKSTSKDSYKSKQDDAMKCNATDKNMSKNEDKDQERFALPDSLNQYFVVTPCKLRLVVLLILILTKCKVCVYTSLLYTIFCCLYCKSLYICQWLCFYVPTLRGAFRFALVCLSIWKFCDKGGKVGASYGHICSLN